MSYLGRLYGLLRRRCLHRRPRQHRRTLFRFRHLFAVRRRLIRSLVCIGKNARWVNACNLFSGLGFDKVIVYEEANGLFVLPSIGSLEVDIQSRTHVVSSSRPICRFMMYWNGEESDKVTIIYYFLKSKRLPHAKGQRGRGFAHDGRNRPIR